MKDLPTILKNRNIKALLPKSETFEGVMIRMFMYKGRILIGISTGTIDSTHIEEHLSISGRYNEEELSEIKNTFFYENEVEQLKFQPGKNCNHYIYTYEVHGA